MNTHEKLTRWATHRESRKADRWHWYLEKLPQRPASATKQRNYIRLYFFSLLLGLAVAIGSLFTPKALLAWIPFTLIMCVSWTKLRWSIHMKDDAPLEVLDEYEASVVNSWRKISFDLFTRVAVIATVLYTIISATWMTDPTAEFLGLTPLRWVYTVSLLFILTLLCIVSLPAIGYAMAFPNTEQNEGSLPRSN